MNGYIGTILIISVIGGIASCISPSNRTKKHINFIIGLITTIALITPIVKIANNTGLIKNKISEIVSEISQNDKIDASNKIIVDTASQKVCEGIKEAVATHFKIDNDNIRVTALFDTSNSQAITVERIDIVLLDKASWLDSHQVKNFAQEMAGCRVTVTKR